MIFDSRISGIPCQIAVQVYIPSVPMHIYDSRYGDADAPIPQEMEYEVLDTRGNKADWLKKKITQDDEDRLIEEYQLMRIGERYGYIQP